MLRHYIFLTLTGLIFLALAIVFLFFPRSTFSELERRELKRAPEFSTEKLFSGKYTDELSSWFSDSQPFRDRFMSLSMSLKKLMAYNPGATDEQFSFHQADNMESALMPGALNAEESAAARALQAETDALPDQPAAAGADAPINSTRGGTFVIGSGENVRALMSFSGTEKSANPYISTVNEYARTMPGVKIYSMVVPIAIEFYCPAAAREKKGLYTPQLPIIRHIYSSLQGAHPVNVYNTLNKHSAENIYLRTDHHWAPLGAYYAAREFARTAGVHIPELTDFDQHTIHRFVGTMYGFSKDIAVKNAPEDFVYYTPKNKNHTCTFTIINLDKDFHVTGEGKPYKTSFFKKFKDGSSNAYLTFMGSDFLIVKVEGGPRNGRKLAILKDSYGNALPGYLFDSFEEVHVLDFRYFPRNIVQYCRDNGITDFLFVNNIFNACSTGVAAKQKALLTRKAPAHTSQPSASASPKEAPAKEASAKESSASAKDTPAPTQESQAPAQESQAPAQESQASTSAPSAPEPPTTSSDSPTQN